MRDDATVAPIIDNALARIGVAPQDRGRFADRILLALPLFFPPRPGDRISAQQILSAIERIEGGVRDIAAGLLVIHDARMTITPNAKRRSESLDQIQKAVLGQIAEAVFRAIPSSATTYDQFAAAMPQYGSLPNFGNSWRGTFEKAAARIGKLRAAFKAEDFRAPTKDIDETFVRTVGALGVIFRDATGKEAKAYAPGGDTANKEWRPPFCQFIAELWPLIGEQGAPVPSNRRIADALKHASTLPPADMMK